MTAYDPHDVSMFAIVLCLTLVAFLVCSILDRRDTKRHEAIMKLLTAPIEIDASSWVRLSTMVTRQVEADRRAILEEIGKRMSARAIDDAQIVGIVRQSIDNGMGDLPPWDKLRALLIEGFDAHELASRQHFDTAFADARARAMDQSDVVADEDEADAVEQMTGVIKHALRDVLHDVLNGGAMNEFIDRAVGSAITKRLPDADQFEATVKAIVIGQRAARKVRKTKRTTSDQTRS